MVTRFPTRVPSQLFCVPSPPSTKITSIGNYQSKQKDERKHNKVIRQHFRNCWHILEILYTIIVQGWLGTGRIHRQYYYGQMTLVEAFSDHIGLLVRISFPQSFSKLFCPKGRQSFKLRDEVVQDPKFQANLAESMISWQTTKAFGMDIMLWWELVVKPGIKKLGMYRGKDLMKASREELNLLLVRQAYLNKTVKMGQSGKLGELRTVHKLIKLWYERECSKIKDQSRGIEYQESEKVTIYHQEIHKKTNKKNRPYLSCRLLLEYLKATQSVLLSLRMKSNICY